MLARMLGFLTALTVTIVMVWPATLVAAADPSIKGQLRAGIQSSMQEFIDSARKMASICITTQPRVNC